ncbi:lysoplasmalogenase [Aquimarina sp. D1M17]|uniref:lysoplasmalogenase n=1 Tax=Aquimarina acroporae TaxID=2937283 RepID=UPI0020BE256F|nr:lysoplasmalogenase [Aquimarina acroporae]MCK8521198.1 lysoplasmalogenase [Aquimarina acroporae]
MNLNWHKKRIRFVGVFFLIVLADLICGTYTILHEYRLFTKPAILVSLILFLVTQRNNIRKPLFIMVFLALVFSLLGDVFLLFTQNSNVFFMLGLTMFLIAHLVYILIFLKNRSQQGNKRLFPMLTLIYGVLLFALLYEKLGSMLIPVAIYMIVILFMSNTAYFRSRKVSGQSYVLVLAGALFFMLSDSLLAIDMFYKTLPYNNVLVMSTYAVAQLLIFIGILEEKGPANS